MTMSAVILAGSRGGIDPLAAAEGVPHKALITIDGRTMLERVAKALRAAGASTIAVSTNDPAVVAHAEALGLRVLAAATGPSASVALALQALGPPLLVTTADHALLDAQWIDDFVRDIPPGTDIAVLLAERARVGAAAPDSRRTYLRFADGAWSGCNLFYLATGEAARAIGLWRAVEADRKRPWRIVRRFGPGVMLRYLIGRLTLGDAVARLGRTADVRAAAVAARDGFAAVDVDTIADLADVRRIIASRR